MAFIIERGILRKYIPQDGEDSILIPEHVRMIDEKAFENCQNLFSVKFPEGVTNIGAYAFHNCRELVFVKLPQSLTRIGVGAFSGCTGLGSAKIPGSVTYLRDLTFENCESLVMAELPETMTKIGDKAFLNCKKLKKVRMPDMLEYLGKKAFFNCQHLKSVVIPEGPPVLYSNQFGQCYSLRFAMIARSIQDIAYDAFPETTVLHFRIRNDLFTVSTEQFSTYLERRELLKAFCQPELPGHIRAIAEFFIIHDNAESLGKFLECGFISADTIDVYIRLAIEKQKYQAQLALMEYKHQHLGYQTQDLFL